jgi:hypothetical protein
MNTSGSGNWHIDNSSTAIANNATKGGVAGGIGIKNSLLLGSLDVLDHSDRNDLGNVRADVSIGDRDRRPR